MFRLLLNLVDILQQPGVYTNRTYTPPGEQLADSVPPCHSQPDCTCFDVNDSPSA